MKKRIVSIALTGGLLLSLLTACGGEKPAANSELPAENPEVSQSVPIAPEPTESEVPVEPEPSASPQNIPDSEKDLEKLRHNASFEVEVGPDLYWVPVNALGTSRYTNEEIAAMLDDTPEEKREKISTLYEALQLYQIGDFQPTQKEETMQSIFSDGRWWSQSPPGELVVEANRGGCSFVAAWLNYLLQEDYDECGYFQFAHINGGNDDGHVYNYIKQGEWYFFIDLNGQRNDNKTAALEEGNRSDFESSNQSANLIKAKSLQDYADCFCPRACVFVVAYAADKVVDASTELGQSPSTGEPIRYTYYSLTGVEHYEVLFDNPTDNRVYEFVEGTTASIDWETLLLGKGTEDGNSAPPQSSPQQPGPPHLGPQQSIVSEDEVLAKIKELGIGDDTMVLQYAQFIVQPESGFGGASSATIGVYLGGARLTEYTVESSDPGICTCERGADGMLIITGMGQPGDSWITITCGKVSARFRWHVQ